jgi:N6-adenosine-specific RNA methylase IME4
MTINEIIELDVKSLAANDSVLALWVPSSLLIEGLDAMKQWGFTLKQTHIWVKIKIRPLDEYIKMAHMVIKDLWKVGNTDTFPSIGSIQLCMHNLLGYGALSEVLAFGMGRLFRQTHEVCLIGTRGKPYKYLKNKSQRSVHFAPVLKHSSKPEALQDMLDKMFPRVKKLELFARRDRKGWTCVGLECPSTLNEDVRDSIERLQ